jgi:two-component sensor histidine kinase
VHVNGKFQELSCLVYDNTDRKEIDRKIRDSLKEKEVLLKEVHHRVKNNLQVISSILNLQSSYVDDPKTLEILRESQQRIKSMSFIHETIYRTSDFSRLEFMDYLKTIISNLIQSYRSAKTRVDFVSEMHSVGLNLDQAIPCGLIVNELVSNSLKYAFKGREHGKLTVRLNEEDGVIMLAVMDDGIGLPADFAFEKNNSLGIQLVYALLDQIDATVNVVQTEGTQFFISFKRK